MAGYTRQSVADIINGANITAPPLNSEFNQLQAAFAASTGHSHDGTTGNAPLINLATSVSGYLPAANGGSGGLNNLTATTNPTITNDTGSGYAVGSVWVNTSTDECFVCTDATAGAAIWQKTVFEYANSIKPLATNTVDLGTSSLKYKDIYIDGTGYLDALSVSGASTFTGTVTTGNISQTSGTATFATVDVNGGAIDGTAIGATTPSTVVGTTITANTGFTGNLTGNVTYVSGTPTSTFYNVTVNGTLNAPNSNITGNITATTGTSTFNNVTITGTLDMDANTASTITGLSAPTSSTDAATKAYVDTSISNLIDSAPGALDTLNELAAALNDDATFYDKVVLKTGSTMTGTLDMGAQKITTTYTPTNGVDLTTKAYTDATFLKLAGGTMTGGITMGSNVISATYTPTNTGDLTTKTYVDSILGSATAASASAAAAAVSEANAATSESNASTSETNAATSATNASNSASSASTSATNAASSESNALTYKNATEAAYDSFDDRYLGAKASAPSVDNDGNALLDGALYWDTTLNVMRVYDLGGTAWVTIADADDVAIVATNITDVNTFAARYRIGATDPTTSLDAGDLFYNTTGAQLKVYNGSVWEAGVAAGSGLLTADNNLNDLSDAATARQNLGLEIGVDVQPYNTEARHSIRPSLLLDFANSKRLDPRITFTRSSTATYYDGKTFAKAEENLLTYSQDLGQFAKDGVTVTTNSTTAPDGTTTAETITEWADSGSHNLVQSNNPVISGQTYTLSVYAKIASGTRNLGFRGFGNGGTGEHPIFNISSGTIAQAGTKWSDATITDVGNGWYRCSAVTTATSATQAHLHLVDGTSTTYTGDGTSGLYLWGAQLEQRSSVTAYTPTTTQPITNYIPVLQTAASGAARFDHDPITGESKGLLIEEQRTNLLTYSEDFANASWGKVRSSVASNVIVAPDGTLTGDGLVSNGTVGSAYFLKDMPGLADNTEYTFSCFAKAGDNSLFRLLFRRKDGIENGIIFDLSDGSYSSGSIDYSITPVGNGWYRCTVTVNTLSGGTTPRVFLWDATADGVINSGIYIWGAQLEEGSFPTSYIKTTSAQVTRNSDSASMTGTNFSSWYRQDEGSVYSETNHFTTENIISAAAWGFDDGTSDNRMWYYANKGQFIGSVNGTTTFNIDLANPTENFAHKACATYKVNDMALSIDGSTVSTDTSSTVSVVTTFGIGRTSASNVYLNGTIKKLAYYPTRLTNAEIQALTEA